MNIFYLDRNIIDNVKAHIDAHVVKMPLEATQLACTTLWVDKVLGYTPRLLTKAERDKLTKVKKESRLFPYLPTHVNHPCAIWARTSLSNYNYLGIYATVLGSEYTRRYNKTHKSIREVLSQLPDPSALKDIGFTEPPKCLPEEYDVGDVVESYRTYYRAEKAQLKGGWKDCENIPYWL